MQRVACEISATCWEHFTHASAFDAFLFYSTKIISQASQASMLAQVPNAACELFKKENPETPVGAHTESWTISVQYAFSAPTGFQGGAVA